MEKRKNLESIWQKKEHIYKTFGRTEKFAAKEDLSGNSEEFNDEIERKKDELIFELNNKIIILELNREKKRDDIVASEIAKIKEKIEEIKRFYGWIKDKESREKLDEVLLTELYGHTGDLAQNCTNINLINAQGLLETCRNISRNKVGKNENDNRVYVKYKDCCVTKVGKLRYMRERNTESNDIDDDKFIYVYEVRYIKVDYPKNFSNAPKTIFVTTTEDLIAPDEMKKKSIEKLLSTDLLEASTLPCNGMYIGRVLPNGEMSLAQKEIPEDEVDAYQASVQFKGMLDRETEKEKLENKYGHRAELEILKTNKDKNQITLLDFYSIPEDEIESTRDYGNGIVVKRNRTIQYEEENFTHEYSVYLYGRKKPFTIYTIEDLINPEDKEQIIREKLLSKEVLMASQIPSNGGFIGKITDSGELTLADQDFLGDIDEKKAFAAITVYKILLKRIKEDKEALAAQESRGQRVEQEDAQGDDELTDLDGKLVERHTIPPIGRFRIGPDGKMVTWINPEDNKPPENRKSEDQR